MQETSISWTDYTWNPTHGCSKVSAGCDNCYAEEISLEMEHTDAEWTNENASRNVTEKPHKLQEPYDTLTEPTSVFVNSMSDLFHSEVSVEFIQRVFRTIRNTPRHIYQILTKRPRRAAELNVQYPPNVWLGTSVEEKSVTPRIKQLTECDAETLFVSFEPLIESVGRVDLTGIDWAIVGGENTADENRREMDHSWARNIKHQCRRDDVAFYFKQSSGRHPETGTKLRCVDDSCSGYVRREIQEKPTACDVVLEARNQYNTVVQGSLSDF